MPRSSPRIRIPRGDIDALRADLRGIFAMYDLEMVFEDEEVNNPKKFITKQEDGTMTVSFRPYDWKPIRAPVDRTQEYAEALRKSLGA